MLGQFEKGKIIVPGAALFYRAIGSGPVVVLVAGGAGDSKSLRGLVRELAQDHRVITYDRRGLSASKVEDADAPCNVTTHAEDLRRVVEATADDAAFVIGTDIGAVIGLEFTSQHPDHVRHLLSYEPPLVRLLPDSARSIADTAIDEVADLLTREGTLQAIARFGAAIGFNPDDCEPEWEPPGPPTPQSMANLKIFLHRDLPVVRGYQPDLQAIDAAARRCSLGVGSHRPTEIDSAAAARALAATTRCEIAQFHGDHRAAEQRPTAFASRMRELFASAD